MFIYDEDALCDQDFLLMLKRFEENVFYFNRFLSSSCIGHHVFKKDDYVFEFFNYLGFTTEFTITYTDNKTKFTVTLEPVFKRNDFSNYSYYFSSLFVLDKFMNRIDHIYIFRIDTNTLLLDDFFSEVIRNYSFTNQEFKTLISQYRSLFNVENFELFKFMFSSNFFIHNIFNIEDFLKLKASIVRFLFLDKKENHAFLNTAIHRFLKNYI